MRKISCDSCASASARKYHFACKQCRLIQEQLRVRNVSRFNEMCISKAARNPIKVNSFSTSSLSSLSVRSYPDPIP